MHLYYRFLFPVLIILLCSSESSAATHPQGVSDFAIQDEKSPSCFLTPAAIEHLDVYRLTFDNGFSFRDYRNPIISVNDCGLLTPGEQPRVDIVNGFGFSSRAFSNYLRCSPSAPVSSEIPGTASSGHKVVTEALTGAGTGLLLALTTIALSPGGEDGPLFLGSIAYVLGVPIGVSLVGHGGDDSGSTSRSFLGSFLGGALSIPIILFVWDKESLAALGAVSLFSFPIAGATIGFNIKGRQKRESLPY